MNHPEPKEWLSYLENDLPADAERRLTEHLGQCAECAAELAGWRKSIQTLRSLKWPEHKAARGVAMPVLLKWGIAALLVLGLGFTLGTLSGPNERQIASRIRDQLRQELRTDLLAAVSRSDRPERTTFQRQLRTDVASFLAEASSDSRAQMAEAVRQARQDDQRDMVTLITRLQQQTAEELIALRKDLESLASTADARLQQTRWQLTQLAANSHGAQGNQ